MCPLIEYRTSPVVGSPCLEHFATLIEQNTLKDSNHCLNSLSIRQWSKDLKHLISGKGLPGLQGKHLCSFLLFYRVKEHLKDKYKNFYLSPISQFQTQFQSSKKFSQKSGIAWRASFNGILEKFLVCFTAYNVKCFQSKWRVVYLV